jgi:two-component system, cell cycle response regulator
MFLLMGIPSSILLNLLIDRVFRSQQRLKQSQLELQEANQALQRLANIDELTQIGNRRAFDQKFQEEWNRCIREQHPLTLIIGDVDYFKRFNDTYGHVMGDYCLIQVAQAIQRSVRRSGDFVARYGGEEFAVILPNTDVESGLKVAEAIQAEIYYLQIEHRASSVSAYVSISLGVASIVPNQHIDPSVLIGQSDRKLYCAKERGRNQISYC